MNTGLKRGMVSLVSYSSDWSVSFETEKNKLVELIGNHVVEIYHIGSTSIPNIYSKPIIDMLVVVKSKKDVLKIRTILENNNYTKSSFEPRGHFLFKKEKDEISTHYIHLVEVQDDWQRYVLFRDYLINNPTEAHAYDKLKITMSEEYSNDRIKYTAIKLDFIEDVMNKIRTKKQFNGER